MRSKNMLSIAGVLRPQLKLKHNSLPMMILCKKEHCKRKEVYSSKKVIKKKIGNSAKTSMTF